MLVSVGVVITIAIVALSTYLLFDVDPLIGCFGLCDGADGDYAAIA